MFNEMYSAGSQIGRMASLLEVLLKAWKGKAALKSAEAQAAIEAFERMQTDIQKAKAEHPNVRSSTSWMRCVPPILRPTSGPSPRYALACWVSRAFAARGGSLGSLTPPKMRWRQKAILYPARNRVIMAATCGKAKICTKCPLIATRAIHASGRSRATAASSKRGCELPT